MADDAEQMKARLRADLVSAMKARRADEARVIRALVAALDNAEAPPLPAGQKPADINRFEDGSAEVARLALDAAQVRAVIAAELHEREAAAAEMERLGQGERAETLRAEVLVAGRYLKA
jgi:uncharacterized protein YqeY